jgi:hypothetical protein
MNHKTGKFGKCDFCESEVWIFKYEFTNKNHFCGIKCSNEIQKNENHPRWKGCICLDGHGYNMIRVNGRYVYEHRHLMEQKIGRKLNRNEQVHHVNENKLDNRIENLVLLENSDHQKLHGMQWKGLWSKKFDSCIECKTTEKRHSGHGLCNCCHQRKYKEMKRATQV